jgi:beta-glucosidase
VRDARDRAAGTEVQTGTEAGTGTEVQMGTEERVPGAADLEALAPEAGTPPAPTPEERANDLIRRMTLEEKTSQLLHESPAIERLGIPAYNWWGEALHGIARAGRATIFPQAIGLAATFNPETMEAVARVISDEGRAKYAAAVVAGNRGQYRGLTFWTPNVNIFRDPRWGRGQETYGEDPFLTGLLGSVFVRTMQETRDGVMKTATCAKHFAVHSGPEALRHEFDARTTPQDLRETYLAAFETLVRDAGVEAVMGAYNRTNGEACCASPTLLTGILREEWGFRGHVVSDCWAIRDFHESHHITAGPLESVALAIEAGCDLNCGSTYGYALEAVRAGLLPAEAVDRALRRLLVTRFKLGILGGPGAPAGDPVPPAATAVTPHEVSVVPAAPAAPAPATARHDPWQHCDIAAVDGPAHREVARQAAAESMVLLKNNGILPLSPAVGSVYITGPNAVSPEALLGNYYGLTGEIVTPLEGLIRRIPEGTSVDYRRGALLDREKPNPVDWAVFEAARHEVTIAFIGLDGTIEGEEGDAIASAARGDRETLALPPGQVAFLRRMKEGGARLVVVVTGGGAIDLGEVHDLAEALIMGWYPGAEGGNAIADVLYGDSSPGGSLPVTFYRTLEDLPPYTDYAMRGRTYRYFRGTPLYPFGFGLRYTTFSLSRLELPRRIRLPGTPGDHHGEPHGGSDGGTAVTVGVTNTGERSDACTLQLYLIPPEGGDGLPLASLRGVRRVALSPGETAVVSLTIPDAGWYHYDREGRRHLPVGVWRVVVGMCAPGPRGTELGAPLPAEASVEVVPAE